MTTRALRSAEAWYGLLLRVYPCDYRRRFAADMRETFLQDLARVRSGSWLALVPFWIVTITQALWFGSAERRSVAGAGAPMSEPSSSRFGFSPFGSMSFAVRQLRRSPLFAATSVISLAVGLAATTVMFSLADALLLQSSPGVTVPDRIVDIGRATRGSGHDNLGYPLFRHLRDHTTTLERIAATTFGATPVSLTDADASERVFAQLVSHGYFQTMGVSMTLGREFLPAEDSTAGERPVAVLSHRFWHERFQGDVTVVGRIVRLNNVPFTVVGVAGRAFEGETFLGTDLWVPMSMVGPIRGLSAESLLNNPRSVWHTAVGRLKPGVSIEAARQEFDALLDGFRQATPAIPEEWSLSVQAYGRVPPMVRLPFTAFVGLLFALTVGLLAIACSNVAGILMARATARRREIATRLAIGATKWQIITQLVAETLVLFLCAFVVAAPLTFWLLGLLGSMVPALPLPLQLDLTLSGRSLVFAAAAALVTGALFGLLPARQALRGDLAGALHGRPSTAARDRVRLRQALVVAQVALSLTLVITAALFVRTLLAASTIDPGFRTDGIEVVSLDTTLAGAQDAAAAALVDRVVERVRAIGGVDAVAHSRMVPLQGGGFGLGGLRVPGATEAQQLALADTDWDVVSPDYFSVIGMRLVEGRAFSPDDRAGQPAVAIINASLARTLFPGEAAVGRQIWLTEPGNDEGTPMRIVGVASDASYRYIGEAQRPFIYVPFAQQPQSTVNLYLRVAPGRQAMADVRRVIREVEPSLPVLMVQPLDEAAAIGLLPQRIAAWVAGAVGVVGLLLAALGLYGLMAFLVEQRTREIAIRMALGATLGQVRGMVLRQAAALGVTGMVAGLGLAAGIGTVVQNLGLLINVAPIDPISFVGLSAVLAVVLFAAGDHPARRAARTNPAATLKAD